MDKRKGMGWRPDLPDFRDYTVEQEEAPARVKSVGQRETVKALRSRIGVAQPDQTPNKKEVDLREWFSPIEDQGELGSCTAQAAVGLLEYFERRAFNRHIDASRLFLYKATRNLMRETGDTGAYIRTAMGALVLFGVPPEEHWPYVISAFDIEPPAFCYAFAQNYQAIQYYRLDPPHVSREDLLARIKADLAAGLPSMFGFTVFSSIQDADASGKIPFPSRADRQLGGHAVVAAGYDDSLKIPSAGRGGRETTGALLIRNSWGAGWGQAGYGWLPYEYVLQGLAVDWWSLIKSEWVETGQFRYV